MPQPRRKNVVGAAIARAKAKKTAAEQEKKENKEL